MSTALPSDPVKFHFIVPVWGQDFCRLFTDIALPSQLSENNIPAISALKASHYHIITTKNDAALIEASASFKKLSQTIEVTTSIYEGDLSVPHDAMSACYRIGIDAANARSAAIVFLTPDLIWSDGSFVELERIANDGHRVVHTLGLRLLKETFVPAVAQAHRSSDGASLCIASRDLVQMALQHLHPIAQSHLWEEHASAMMPANLYWRVDGEGLLTRCFHLHPLLVNPTRRNAHFQGTVDDDFVLAACPDSATDYVVTDSDRLLACEISRASHAVQTNLRKGHVSDIAEWAEGAANARHRELVRHPIRFHACACSEDKWRAVEERSGAVIDQALAMLDAPWAALLVSRPKVLLRRVVRVAQDTVTRFKNAPDQFKLWPWLGAKVALGVYQGYVDLCRAYTVWRPRLNDALFGPAHAPYPWHPLWSAHRALAPIVTPLLTKSDGALLLLSDDAPLSTALEALVRARWAGEVFTASAPSDVSALHGPFAMVLRLSCDPQGDAQNGLADSPPQQTFVVDSAGAANASRPIYKLFTWRPSPVLIEMALLVAILPATALLSLLINLMRSNNTPPAHLSVYTSPPE